MVLDPEPGRVYKRFDTENLDRLDSMFSGNDNELINQILTTLKVTNLTALSQKSALPMEEVSQIVSTMLERGEVIGLGNSRDIRKITLISPAYWQTLYQDSLEILTDFHQSNPYKAGMPREELRTELNLSQVLFDQVLDKMAEDLSLIQKGSLVWATHHHVVLTPADQAKVAPILAEFLANQFSPPDINQLQAQIGTNLLEGLLSSQILVAVSDQVVFTPEALLAMREWVQDTIRANGELSLAQFRDQFSTSRKYAAAVLEYFDSIGFTYRKGDVRGLR
jgi:selenocysteine-specific elongation factor